MVTPYRLPMSDASAAAAETWADYLRRMTQRPGWSVARLARESGIHRGTIFKYLAGESGVTVDTVRRIAKALGDDPENALRAAAQIRSGAALEVTATLGAPTPKPKPAAALEITADLGGPKRKPKPAAALEVIANLTFSRSLIWLELTEESAAS